MLFRITLVMSFNGYSDGRICIPGDGWSVLLGPRAVASEIAASMMLPGYHLS